MKYVTLEYPKSVHCPQESSDIRKVWEDAAFVAKVYERGDGHYRPRTNTTETAHIDDAHANLDEGIAELKKHFKFDGSVENYLRRNPSLLNILFDAVKQIRAIFKERYKHSLVFPPKSRKLFVDIRSKLDFDNAIAALNEFDNNWWFGQPAQIRTRLEFSLKFE